jgi:hypothetical protein
LEALAIMNIKTMVFWSVKPYSVMEDNRLVSIQLSGMIHSSETMVTLYQATWHNIPEQENLYLYLYFSEKVINVKAFI